MTFADMLALTRPFKGPFRVVTSNGESYDVRHREGFILTTDYLFIGLLPSPSGEFFVRTTHIDLVHIVRVEPLPQPAPAKGDGQTS